MPIKLISERKSPSRVHGGVLTTHGIKRESPRGYKFMRYRGPTASTRDSRYIFYHLRIHHHLVPTSSELFRANEEHRRRIKPKKSIACVVFLCFQKCFRFVREKERFNIAFTIYYIIFGQMYFSCAFQTNDNLFVRAGLHRRRGRDYSRYPDHVNDQCDDDRGYDDGDDNNDDNDNSKAAGQTLRLQRHEGLRKRHRGGSVQRLPSEKRLSSDVCSQRAQVAVARHSRERQRDQEQHAAIQQKRKE